MIEFKKIFSFFTFPNAFTLLLRIIMTNVCSDSKIDQTSLLSIFHFFFNFKIAFCNFPFFLYFSNWWSNTSNCNIGCLRSATAKKKEMLPKERSKRRQILLFQAKPGFHSSQYLDRMKACK